MSDGRQSEKKNVVIQMRLTKVIVESGLVGNDEDVIPANNFDFVWREIYLFIEQNIEKRKNVGTVSFVLR